MFWALRFMKCYNTWDNLAAEVGGKDSKTTQKWVWFYIEGIARLSRQSVSNYTSNFLSFKQNCPSTTFTFLSYSRFQFIIDM